MDLSRSRKKPIPHLRWWIIGVCFLGATINYIDRQCLSVAAPTICKEFGFTNADYASMVSSFLVAYTIMQFVAGAVMDRIGVRLGMAAFAAWWSVAGMLHALCGGLRTIMLTLPTDLFSPRQTGSVSGLSGTGAGLGGLAFTYVIGKVADRFSYTPIFLAAGLMPLAALAIVQLLIPKISAASAGFAEDGEPAQRRQRPGNEPSNG